MIDIKYCNGLIIQYWSFVNALTLVHIHDEFTSIIEIQKKKNSYRFSSQKNFIEPHEIALYLKPKKNIYLLFSSNNTIETSIILPSVIKNEATILGALMAKRVDEPTSNKPIIFNRLNTVIDSTGESATHRYEGVYEQEVLNAIIAVPHLEYLRRITTEQYALFSLCEESFKGKNYLGVYTSENKNLIVAVQNSILLFSRVGELQSQDESERAMEQIRDINQTVAYAHQQYREASFEFIVLSGTIFDGEITSLQLHAITGLPITVLAPTLMVQGLESRNAQKNILEVGLLYLNPAMNFIPNKVKMAKEFYLASFISLGIAFIFMVFSLFQSYEAYSTYQESLDEYTVIESKLFQNFQSIKKIDKEQLEEIIAQLKSFSPLQHHFIDDLIPFDDLLKLIKPNNVAFEENNGSNKLVLNFTRKSQTLMDLYLFEKTFKYEVNKINNPSLISTYTTDYNTLTFESTLKIGDISEVVQ